MKWLVLPFCLLLPPSLSAGEKTEDTFARQIHPLLKNKCLGCHGEDPKLRGGLDLRTREGMLKGGDTGAALVPGNPAKSLLYQSVLRTGDLVMPPKESARLSAEEIAALKSWIDAGAPWPREKVVAGEWKIDPRDAWAFQPVQKIAVPSLKDAAAVRTPIDAFIVERLQEKGLNLAPPADRLTLLRRATFDLTGLPPTPEEIEAFLQDDTPGAFAKVLDRLLQSPHYGERMAQHWLDVVRYADTAGFSNDYERPHAWRYRDYVIRSFNQDKAFDRFILEQIAGDELEPDNPETALAVGFLRMGPWEHTGMSVAAVTRQMFLDDATNAIGVTFLGQGLSCARCHDHKFDPIPTKDYYRLQAVLAGTQFTDRQTPFLPAENTTGFVEARAFWQARLKDHQEQKNIRPLSETLGNKTFTMISKKHDDYYQRALRRYEPLGFSVSNDKPTEVAILKGGALEAPGDVVTPGVLSAVEGLVANVPHGEAGRRLALARWIASPRNPLTARVIVNRVWQMHFGTGLVVTPNNFGKMGGRPSHPELLDWLAGWFIEQDWSLKKLHRLIMTSRVYQQSGWHPDMEQVQKRDAKNRLLAYFPPRRLSAEEIRDSVLAVSGELSPARGGPGVFPEINWEVALQPRHTMGGIAPAYQPSRRPEERNRRTVYVFRYRTLPDPMLEVLNRPGADLSCERRDETTVTPQVFALFNSQSAHDRALALARRLEKTHAAPADRVDLAFRLLYGRLPTAQQKQLCLAHVDKMTEHHEKHVPVKQSMPAKVVRQMVAEQTGELFRWEELLDTKHYVADVKPWDVGPETRAWAELCLVLMNANEFVYVY